MRGGVVYLLLVNVVYRKSPALRFISFYKFINPSGELILSILGKTRGICMTHCQAL
jgi:hypothetical protein